MLQHPFFKISFFALLTVDICYSITLVLVGLSPVSMSSVYASAIWFVTFFWLPVWLAGYLILKLRQNTNIGTIVEWLIVIVALSLGNAVTDLMINSLYQVPRMGWYVVPNALFWGTIIYFIFRFLETRQKALIETQSRKQAQLESLRYQLNPHFMFNSLNTISAYIHTNPDLADDVLHELADILRYSLDTSAHKFVPLSQELGIIKKYLNIEKARFADKLEVTIDSPTELNNVNIPPLVIQPIIENAIKHNAKQTNLKIAIKIRRIDNKLMVTVTDNGTGFIEPILTQGYGKGVGMKNLQQRIDQLEGGKIHLANVPGAQVKLEVPLC
ncbi:sensor histidine kinase [Thalassotalea marina]|uniref:Histidine kinase domain-containing protein n=1 Tax=Thalassotalea marina TaxID=1673741 RepID=A0A919EHH8_9GAMM|nr:histidine kinase [Thalassotalea marina]GHF83900.1 hypothetical protein GCM10017161_09030 [Thalassotalea marina]